MFQPKSKPIYRFPQRLTAPGGSPSSHQWGSGGFWSFLVFGAMELELLEVHLHHLEVHTIKYRDVQGVDISVDYFVDLKMVHGAHVFSNIAIWLCGQWARTWSKEHHRTKACQIISISLLTDRDWNISPIRCPRLPMRMSPVLRCKFVEWPCVPQCVSIRKPRVTWSLRIASRQGQRSLGRCCRRNQVGAAVVKIFVTRQRPALVVPWQLEAQKGKYEKETAWNTTR